jgi:ABC-type Fe3+ transport system substrate-binding protein
VPANPTRYLWLVAFALVLLAPYAFRPQERTVAAVGKKRIVILSPHSEGIRFEFEAAFDEFHKDRFGQGVDIDWRNVGGTSQISRYLRSEFSRRFREFHEAEHGSPPPPDFRMPDGSDLTNLDNWNRFGIGVDIFFGGGDFDHGQAMRSGFLAPASVEPEILASIPAELAGIKLYEPKHHWFGAALSGFGIVFNRVVLARPEISLPEPKTWRDLTDPRYLNLLGLADPRLSGSATKGFEMILQCEMNRWPDDQERGWREGMKVIQLLSANARYFTDSSSTVPLDVGGRNAAAGMAIDFYGKFQAEFIGNGEVGYTNAVGGTVIAPDPISMLLGAPNRQAAERFINFVLSPAGQMLWDLPAGFRDEESGLRGPLRHCTRRMPIRPDVYERYAAHLKDPENPFEEESTGMRYQGQWTGSLFNFIRVYIGAMCVDTHDLLREAWRAIQAVEESKREPLIEQLVQQPVGYLDAKLMVSRPERAGALNPSPEQEGLIARFRTNDPREKLAIREEWASHFRKQYQQVIDRAGGMVE